MAVVTKLDWQASNSPGRGSHLLSKGLLQLGAAGCCLLLRRHHPRLHRTAQLARRRLDPRQLRPCCLAIRPCLGRGCLCCYATRLVGDGPALRRLQPLPGLCLVHRNAPLQLREARLELRPLHLAAVARRRPPHRERTAQQPPLLPAARPRPHPLSEARSQCTLRTLPR